MLEKIMKRLDEEIAKLEAEVPEKHMYLWGKYVEAAYLRAIFLQMIKKDRQDMKETEVLKMVTDMWQERLEERGKDAHNR